jgi:hypothetical protein
LPRTTDTTARINAAAAVACCGIFWGLWAFLLSKYGPRGTLPWADLGCLAALMAVTLLNLAAWVRRKPRVTDWAAATPEQRARQVTGDLPSAPGWREHQRACTSEGSCPVCLDPLTGPGPAPGYAVAAGNCQNPRCPAAPCRWAVSVPQPATGRGALMWAPLRGQSS